MAGSRTFLAAVTAIGLGVGLTGVPGTIAAHAAASTGGEVVVPAAERAVPRATQILVAGTSGFLWVQEADDRLLWTDYRTGAITPLAQRLDVPISYDIDSGRFARDSYHRQPGRYGAGSDTLALHRDGGVTLLQGGTGTVLGRVPIPAGHTYVGTFGDVVVTQSETLHLWRLDGAGVTETPVTGLPDADVEIEDADASSMVLRYRPGADYNGYRFVLLDLATGAVGALPDQEGESWEVTGFRLSRDSVLRLRTGRMLAEVYDRADLTGTGRRIDIGAFDYQTAFQLVGSSLLAVDPFSGDSRFRGQPLYAKPTGVTNGRLTQVMKPAAHQIVAAPDGSVLVAGAEVEVYQGDLDWGVYRISETGGRLVRTRMADVEPIPAQIHGLSLGSGILTRAANSTLYEPSTIIGAYHSTWIDNGAITRSTVDGLISGRDGDCYPNSPRCIRMFADGTGFHGRANSTESGVTMLRPNGGDTWGPSVKAGNYSPNLTDLSGRYGLADGGPHSTQYVIDFDAEKVLQSRTRVAAAVWGSTLWSGTATGGTVSASRLPDGAAVDSFTTPSGCTPYELQATSRWIYWTCVDDWFQATSAGLYDRVAKRSTTAPFGDVLLGDGYLVEHVAGTGLRLRDLTGSQPDRVLVIADQLGRSGTGWTVDRFGGAVAYADDRQRVHVVSTGVPAPALTAIDSTVGTAPTNWTGSWWLSKPAGAWQVTIRDKAGAILHTVSGTSAQGLIKATWNGGTQDFTWTLTARPADGQGADLTLTNAVTSPAPATPRATKAPVVSGAVAVGATVKAVTGTWSPAATSYAYQWLANNTVLKGATGPTYRIGPSLVGKRLTVRVTAKRTGHPSGTATSAASEAVRKGAAPKATKKPRITGTVRVGRTIRVSVGTWSPKADSYRYEWRVNGKLIKSTASGKLKLKAVWEGKRITVTVIARKVGYHDGRATSSRTPALR